MHSWFDLFAKGVLRALLRPIADVETEHEIVGHAQTADLWVEPTLEFAEQQPQLGILGRMLARGPCLIEPFSQTPRPRDIRACICKQYNLDHARTRAALHEKRSTPMFPRLWIISPGQPKTVIEQADCKVMEGWPPGFWETSTWDAFNLVVIGSLPRTLETLPLRLLGRGITLKEAIRDFGNLPDTAWPKRLLLPVLIAFRAEIPQDPLEDELMQAVQEIDAIYEKWEKRIKEEGHKLGREEGHEVGREEGHRAVLIRLLSQRFGELPNHVDQRIRQAGMEQLQRWTDRVIPAKDLADVFE